MARLAAWAVVEQPSDETSSELLVSAQIKRVFRDHVQEELEVALCLGSGVSIGNTCRLPFISTHIEGESVNSIGRGFGDIIRPDSRGVRVCLLVSRIRAVGKGTHVTNHVMGPNVFLG